MFVMYFVRRHIEIFIQKSARNPQAAKGCLKLRGIWESENPHFENILKIFIGGKILSTFYQDIGSTQECSGGFERYIKENLKDGFDLNLFLPSSRAI